MKTVIFIDGENLHHSIKSMNLQEKDIDWTKFLHACLDDGDDLIRAYWYQAAQTSDPAIHNARARKFIEQVPNQSTTITEEKVKSVMKKAEAWKDARNKQYKTKLNFYDNLAVQFSEIEMVRTGLLKIDPFQQKDIGEKGLDVSLAIGMVKSQEYCDKLILVSGDFDYAAAIKFVKDKMKRVHIVRLFKGKPPKNRNVSRKLLELADKVVDIFESDIKNKMRV